MGRNVGSKPRPWTEWEVNQAKLMHERGYSFWKIGEHIGRKGDVVKNKLVPPQPRDRYKRDLPKLKAERDARKAASDRRDLTSTFCGDPPKGYSALDQMRGGR